jgi:hypothetical protein
MTSTMVASMLAVALGLTLAICCFWFWVAMLVNAAKLGKWVWFVMIFVFPLLCVLYWFIGHQPVDQRIVRIEYSERIDPQL